MTYGVYKRNEAGDGWMPCCHKCKKPFGDGDIGSVKNYPEDGLVTVFFKCENCDGEETSFIYQPYKVEMMGVPVEEEQKP